MEIIKFNDELRINYENYYWVMDEFKKDVDAEVRILHIFSFLKDDVIDIDDFGCNFRIAKLINDYYCIESRIFDVNFNVFIYKDVGKLDTNLFSASRYKNVFQYIQKFRDSNEDIYIDGPKSNLPLSDLKSLNKEFPNPYEMDLYKQSRISLVLERYFDDVRALDVKFENYRNNNVISKTGKKKFNIEADILKYNTVLGNLKEMLKNENQYSENEWGEAIANILLLIFPKYINYHKNVKVNMTSNVSNKQKEFLDFMLVKADGCIDVLEIKKSDNMNLISNSCDHDNHYASSKLSKVTMQCEKYLYNITRDSIRFENDINNKYGMEYNDNFNLKVVNPKGLIIIGNSKSYSDKQLLDLEIIRKMYSNIVDIYTYDDIIFMLENILQQLRSRVK